jgi:hypothetical protein
MAYLRKEQETVEIDYPLDEVWAAIPKALAGLEWTVEDIDATGHSAKAKTKSSFMAWGSTILIVARPVNEKTSRVTVQAETAVTTITSIVNFGQTRQRIFLFFKELRKQLK